MKPLFRILCPMAMLIVFYACKKEPSSHVVSTGGQAAYHCGIQVEQRTFTSHDTILYSEGFAEAYFTDTICTDHGPYWGPSVGQVSINGVIMHCEYYSWVPAYSYNDTLGLVFSTPQVVSISGANGYSQGSFTNNLNYPSYKGFKYMPDTIQVYAGCKVVIPVSGFSGSEEVTVSIADMWNTPLAISQNVTPDKQYAEFNYSDFFHAPMIPSERIYIIVSLSKHIIYPLGNKFCRFIQIHSYYAKAIMNPL